MILVDTSVWIAHLREGNSALARLLDDGDAACHSFIIGELACGNIKNRIEVLALLRALPAAVEAGHDEVLGFISRHSLMGRGLGYVDVHILASARLSGALLWTFDKRLAQAAHSMKRAFEAR